MKYFFVDWFNYRDEYRSTIVTCDSKETAKKLIKASYKNAAAIKVREIVID